MPKGTEIDFLGHGGQLIAQGQASAKRRKAMIGQLTVDGCILAFNPEICIDRFKKKAALPIHRISPKKKPGRDVPRCKRMREMKNGKPLAKSRIQKAKLGFSTSPPEDSVLIHWSAQPS